MRRVLGAHVRISVLDRQTWAITKIIESLIEYRAQTAGWRSLAACRDLPVSLFFPVNESQRSGSTDVEAAKTVCSRCVVRSTCLDYAVDACEPAGIWGGMTSDERRAERYRRRQAG